MAGFLKNVGGVKRMRFVKAGYDPDDMGVPPNQVIFDSEDVGTLSTLYSGEWYSPVSSGTGVVFDTMIATWPALSYIPLVTAQFRQGYGNPVTSWLGWSGYVGLPSYLVDFPNNAGFRLQVKNNGVYSKWTRFSTTITRIHIRYQVFRMPT